jgi:hypothetical protein
MAQQTAVEWFTERITHMVHEAYDSELADLFEQAKEMEVEQMRKCASFWRGKENEIEKQIFEQYYNETYGK